MVSSSVSPAKQGHWLVGPHQTGHEAASFSCHPITNHHIYPHRSTGVCTHMHILRKQRRCVMRQSVVITVIILSGHKLQDDLLLQLSITHKDTNNLCKKRKRDRESVGRSERLADTLPRHTAWLCPQRRTTRTVSLLRPGSQPVSIKDPEGTRGTLSAEGKSMNVGGTDTTSAAVFPWKVGQQNQRGR